MIYKKQAEQKCPAYTNYGIEWLIEWLKNKVAETEPELARCMVRECVYRGFCPEMFPCGYSKTEEFQKEIKAYRGE